MDCVVIGGGISGLAAAHRLCERSREHAVPIRITLVEAAGRLGGLIDTQRHGGFLSEGGPDAFVSEKPWGVALCRRLGMAGELISTNPGGRSFIVCRGRLAAVPAGWYLVAPTGISALVRAPFLSWRGKLRLAREPFIPPRRDGGDESVADFIRRRFGQELLERVGEPMIGGIYAADPERLSLQATFPRFQQMEREHGSVAAGLLARTPQAGEDVRGASGPRYSLFLSFKDGVQRLVEALIAAMPEVALRTGSRVVRLERADGWRAQLEGGESLRADAVCVALPAPQASGLLAQADSELSGELARISYVSAATVSMAFRETDLPRPIAGFGFVVPAIERRQIIGCTLSSNKFPGRAPEGMVLARAFLGGAAELAQTPEPVLAQAVQEELRVLLGIAASPCKVWVRRHRYALPQYEVGHLARVERIERLASAQPGLFLTGNGYRGLGIPDCIHQAELVADRLIDLLIQKPGQRPMFENR
jgi:oxygen-dependent protoporphyrinogen oxidase